MKTPAGAFVVAGDAHALADIHLSGSVLLCFLSVHFEEEAT